VPVRLFTDAERERLNRFPRDISPADLLAFFALSDDELELIGDRRGDHNRLGFGLQLKTLPYLGFVPDDLGSAPARVVSYLALQLSAPSDALQQYGDREHTRTDHLQEIQARLGFRDASQHELAMHTTWLLDRALEHDRPIVLFHHACQWLLQERLVRPGVTRIERLVATIRERAQQETHRRLGTLLTPTLRDGLDALLQPTSTTGRTPLSWLQREATALTPRAILDEIEKLNYVRALGADVWQLNSLTPNRRKLLAGIGRRSTNQALQRMSPERRFPILLAFLAQAAEDVTDEIIDLFDRAMTNSYARARRELDEFRRSIARSTNEKVVLFRAMGRVVLDAAMCGAREDHRRAVRILGRHPPCSIRRTPCCLACGQEMRLTSSPPHDGRSETMNLPPPGQKPVDHP
jgi:hypothetical protein